MKKWMITYSFLLVFLSLTLCGHAAPAKTVIFYSSSKPVVKKTSQVAIENKNGGHGDCYAINNRTRFYFSITPSFTLAENNISLPVNYFFKDISAITGAKKVLKDHLLHLFPFHYFW
jgi:hypothetical protein